MNRAKQAVMGILGRSGSGKTTLLATLIPVLTGQGFTVSTVKHTHHGFDVDKPGKDSYRHREAGATEVLLTSARRWALLHEVRDQAKDDVTALIAKMTPVDILLIEGFKNHKFPKIEVFRPSLGKPMIGDQDENVIAVATDDKNNAILATLNKPILNLHDNEAIAAFIIKYLKLPLT